MPILNDAGAAAAYPHEMIEDRLAREQITMASLLAGETFGPVATAVTAAASGMALSWSARMPLPRVPSRGSSE